MSRKYRDAAAKLQQNVQKHLHDMKELSSSEDEEPYEPSVLNGVLKNYTHGGGDNQMLQRTKNLLEESLSGRCVTCLICIGSIKRIHPIWTCQHCFSYFHLSCVQKWSNDSISLRLDEVTAPIQVYKPKKVEWCCPKCRQSYSKNEIPSKYYCFCGKTPDPPLHPWYLPHSCGEVCGKRLSVSDNCKHKCLLLCHPGPCPPCPQMVNGICYCEKERKKVRCSSSKWSCGQKCKKLLQCNSHSCDNICHENDCPPCLYTSLQPCECGSETVKRPCNDPTWRCIKKCNKPFSCGFHKCETICHSGDCGLCPNSGMKSCPCGAVQRYVECPDSMETCIETCGKEHEDCGHSCPEKCHKGQCPPCLVLIEKKCHCRTHVKSLPCSKDFRCDTKCRGIRDCGKHACAKKCCNGNCPPCEKPCDKRLQCGKHKCSMVCHNGPCYPCPRESQVTCRCKETSVTVPCGREKHTKPPKCHKLCKIKYKCGHSTENAHKCHFGDCPPCKAICDKTHKCGHSCPSICHAYVPVVFKQIEKPATPWEIQAPVTKIMALDCPPCEVPVTMECFGKHETSAQPCHQASRYSCGRKCEKPLTCGNHTCQRNCHLFEHDPKYPHVHHVCEACNKECVVARPKKCIHKCPKQSCHPGPCPKCEIQRKIPCFCGLNELYLRCNELETATEEELSCQLQCPKNLGCGHRCKKVCHPGSCPEQVCTKKVKVYCPCGNVKKEVTCNTAKENPLECDVQCADKKKAAQLEKELEQKRKKELEEERNRKELEEYEWKMSGKKKKYKEKKRVENKSDSNFKKFLVPIVSIFIFLISFVYYLFMLE